jgi:hypothetical protein
MQEREKSVFQFDEVDRAAISWEKKEAKNSNLRKGFWESKNWKRCMLGEPGNEVWKK